MPHVSDIIVIHEAFSYERHNGMRMTPPCHGNPHLHYPQQQDALLNPPCWKHSLLSIYASSFSCHCYPLFFPFSLRTLLLRTLLLTLLFWPSSSTWIGLNPGPYSILHPIFSLWDICTHLPKGHLCVDVSRVISSASLLNDAPMWPTSYFDFSLVSQ